MKSEEFASDAVEGRKQLIVLLLIGLAFWLLNQLTGLYADDYSYAFTFGPDGGIDLHAPVAFSNLFDSQYNHYFAKNGRTIAHGLEHLFLCFNGKWVFNLCNAAVFAAFIYRLQVVSGKRNWIYALFITFLLFILTRQFGQVFLWQLGALNYLWAGLFNLLFLSAFCHYRQKETLHFSLFTILFLLPAAVLVGWIHESFSIGMLTIIAMMTLADWRKGKTVPRTSLLITVAYLCGTLLIIFSPGTLRRAADSGIDAHYMLTHLGFGLLNILKNVRFFWLTVIVIGILLLRKRLSFAELWQKERLWLLAILAQTLFLIPLGRVVEPRALFGIELFSLILLLRLLPPLPDRWALPVAVLTVMVYLPVLYIVWQNYRDTQAFHEAMKRYDEVVFFDNPDYQGLRRHFVGSRIDLDHHRRAFNMEHAAYYHKSGLLVLPARYEQELYHSRSFLNNENRTPDGGYTADDVTFTVYPLPDDQPLPQSTPDHEYVHFASGNYLLKDKYPLVFDGNVQKRARAKRRIEK